MRVVVATVVALLLSASTASAEQWLRLDRVETEPAYFDGMARVRFFVSAVKLQGDRIPIHGDKAWTVLIGKSKKNVPYIAGHFQDMQTETAIVLVVNNSVEYSGEILPMIQKELSGFLDTLPDTTRVAVLGYGSRVKGKRKLYSVKSAVKNLNKLEADTDIGDTVLYKAVDKAYKALKKAKPEVEGAPLRKMIIVLSDGRDGETSDSKFTKLAKKAAKYDIPIHSIAFSPTGHRGPLLTLGELSRYSNGTFRWVRDTEGLSGRGWAPQLGNLTDEINEQYVITTFLPIEDIEGKKLSISAKDITSNSVKIKTVVCGDSKEPCGGNQYCVATECVSHKTDSGGGILGWILTIVGIIVAGIVVVGLVGFVLMRRHEKKAARAALDAAAEEAAGPDSHQVQGLAPGQQPGQQVQGLAPGQQPYQAGPPAAAQNAAPAAQPHVGRISAFAVPSSGASLIVVKGPNQGSRIPLHNGFSIGKAPNNDLPLPGDNYASSHHAQIHVDAAGACTLVDQGSTNGTFVNGVRATQKRLQHGMLIRIGEEEFRFLHG